jgi:lipoprotein NlpI
VDPKLAAAYRERGNLKRDRGDLDGALADYHEAIQLQPHRFSVYLEIGIMEETRRNLEGAMKAYAQAAEQIPTGKPRDYIEFSIYLVRGQLGRTDEATSGLSTYLSHRQGPAASVWVTNVANFLIGKLTEDDFIASANAAEPWINEEHHCEAWYYTGMKRLLAGDKKTASDYFTRCLATNRTRFVEYVLARAELKSL